MALDSIKYEVHITASFLLNLSGNLNWFHQIFIDFVIA